MTEMTFKARMDLPMTAKLLILPITGMTCAN